MTSRLPARDLVEDNGGLDGTLVLHGLQTFTPLFKLISLVNDTLNLYLAGV